MNQFQSFRRDVVTIESCCETILQMIQETEQALVDAPAGTLYIKKNGRKAEYYYRHPGTGNRKIYIPQRQMELACLLAQKDYNQKILKFLKKLLKETEKVSESSCAVFATGLPYPQIDAVYYALSLERQALVKPIIPTTDQYVREWLSCPYEPKPFHPDDKSAYYTRKNERVRSKSELHMADKIDYVGIPRLYEFPLEIRGKILHPDFTLLDITTRREKYLEHCGMMDNPEYLDNFLWKMDFYRDNGIHPGEDLIVTMESSARPLNTRIFDLILRHYFPNAFR